MRVSKTLMNKALEREDTTLRNNQDGICFYINNLKDVEYWVSNPEGNSNKGNLNEIEIGELNDVPYLRRNGFSFNCCQNSF